jgi:hypothetical protein
MATCVPQSLPRVLDMSTCTIGNVKPQLVGLMFFLTHSGSVGIIMARQQHGLGHIVQPV